MATRELTRGEDRTFLVPLEKDGVPFVIDDADEVLAALRDTKTDSTKNGDTITCLTGDTGANWATGVVAVTYTDAQTDILDLGLFNLEIQHTDDATGLVSKFIAEDDVCVRDGVL